MSADAPPFLRYAPTIGAVFAFAHALLARTASTGPPKVSDIQELTRAVRALNEWWSDAGLDLQVAATLAQVQHPAPAAAPPPARRAPTRKDPTQTPLERAEALAANAATLPQLEEAARRFAAEPGQRADAAAPFLQGDSRPMLLVAGHGLLQQEGEHRMGPRLFARMLASVNLHAVPLLTLNSAFWRAPSKAPPKAEIALSAPFLLQAIALTRPKLLLLLGETASVLLGGEHALRLRERPQRFHHPNGFVVDAIVTLDPAYLLLRGKDKAEAWADLQRLERQLENLDANKGP